MYYKDVLAYWALFLVCFFAFSMQIYIFSQDRSMRKKAVFQPICTLVHDVSKNHVYKNVEAQIAK